ncbi:MAG TPA: hypothetical protein DCZ43_04350 [candidate division Zixibacteria bacterium]|nr:hypothetical protein [candidate division Zixibacteria bacterium]
MRAILFSKSFYFSCPLRAIKKSVSKFADRLPKYDIFGSSQVKNLLFSKKLLINSFALFWLMPVLLIRRVPNVYVSPLPVKPFLINFNILFFVSAIQHLLLVLTGGQTVPEIEILTI